MAEGEGEATQQTVGVVVNPERAAGGEDLVARLREAGLRVEASTPGSPDDLGHAVDELLAAGADVIVALGGDGTQRTVAERLIGSDVPLAIAPGGTVNLLARVLGIDDIDAAVRAIAGGSIRTIDLGRIDDEIFILNASTGWDAAVIEHVDDRFKRFGRLGYASAALLEWFRVRPHRVTIRLDGTTWYQGPALTVLVLNVGQRGSASLHLAREAELDDGRLDVLVLRRHSVAGFLRVAWSTLRRRDVPRAELLPGQAATVEVVWDIPVAVQRDGDESAPTSTTTYETLPGALRVLVPPPQPE